MPNRDIRAVLWDFGGVMTESPFVAFRRFERDHGLPENFLRSINAHNPDNNAWARFERSELTPEQFDTSFAEESAAAGHPVRGLDVIDLLYGAIRPRMVAAVIACKAHWRNACLTNNVDAGPGRGFARNPQRAREWHGAIEVFDQVLESSKLGARKPERRFFELACEKIQIRPDQAVFLDDLGANLKPARAMGMHTIKVDEPDQALTQLETLLDWRLR
jgi:putative hydrolase of the HAD superfamily